MSNVNIRFDGKLFEQAPEWSGYTTKKNLAKVRQIAPKFGSDIMTFIGTANSTSMSYADYLGMITSVEYDETDDPINRMVYGEGRKFARLIKVIAEDMTRIGYNKARFTMVFDAPFFSDVNLIVGMSDRYKVRIVSDQYEAHGGWAYDCEVFGPANFFVPATEMKENSTWTKEGAPVPLYDSMKGARTSYTSPYAITYDWSSVSTEDSVPGNLKSRPVAFAWLNENGKPMHTWQEYRTWKNDMEFRELKNKTLVWGTSNMNTAGGYDDIDDASGVEIKAGPGIIQQTERGNLYYYNTFDVDEFGDQLLKLRIGKVSSDKLHYVVSTGTRGLVQAHNSIASKASGWEKVDNKSIFGDKLNLGFGNRFTRYLHPGGFYIDFRLEPLFDDQYRTPVKHPDGGYARSYEYHVADLGETQGESSVELHYVNTMADNLAIKTGMRSPYSPTGKKVVYEASSLKDAWTERRMSHFMVIMRNPKNSLIYRPNILK
jgi:hypothetical protein